MMATHAMQFNVDLAKYIHMIDAKLEELRAHIAAPLASPPSVQHDQPSTQVRRLEDAGYTCEPDTDDDIWKDNNTWLISLPGAKPANYIARLAVDVRQGMILVHEAWNKKMDTHKSMKLRDMIMSFWKFKANQEINSLRWIKYKCVVEEYLMPVLNEIYDNILPRGQEDLYIPPAGGGQPIRRAYCKLMVNAPFAIGAKRLLREYFEPNLRRIDGLIISSAGRGSLRDFTVCLGGSTNPNDAITDAGLTRDGANDEAEEILDQDVGDGSLYDFLDRLKRSLNSRLLDEDWVLVGLEGLPDGSSLNPQGLKIIPGD